MIKITKRKTEENYAYYVKEIYFSTITRFERNGYVRILGTNEEMPKYEQIFYGEGYSTKELNNKIKQWIEKEYNLICEKRENKNVRKNI